MSAELTIRERRLIKFLLEGLSATEAMKKAGYSPTTAEKQQKRVLSNPKIQNAIDSVMTDAGITAEALAATMKAGLDATDDTGAPDYYARHKYLETALRVGRHEPAKGSDLEETYEQRIFRLRSIPIGSEPP